MATGDNDDDGGGGGDDDDDDDVPAKQMTMLGNGALALESPNLTRPWRNLHSAWPHTKL